MRQDEIASKFEVSKIPVREALFQLKAEGLVTYIPNRGAVVAEISSAEVVEIYTMRIALETKALECAFQHLTNANLDQLAELIEATEKENNMIRRSEMNWKFHEILYSPANFPRMMEWIKILDNNSTRYLIVYFYSGADFPKRGNKQHREIYEACRSVNLEKSLQHLQDHIQFVSNQLVEFLKERNL